MRVADKCGVIRCVVLGHFGILINDSAVRGLPVGKCHARLLESGAVRKIHRAAARRLKLRHNGVAVLKGYGKVLRRLYADHDTVT